MFCAITEPANTKPAIPPHRYGVHPTVRIRAMPVAVVACST